MFQQAAERDEPPRTPLHNVDETKASASGSGDASPSNASITADGTWGERDVGGPVSFQSAMQEFEGLRNELSHLSKTRTQKTEDGRKHDTLALKKSNTNRSRRARTADLEAQGKETEDYADDKDDETMSGSQNDEFELSEFLREGHFEKRDADKSAKKIGVVYKNLTVQGVGATAVFVKTLPSAILGVSRAVYSCFILDSTPCTLKYRDRVTCFLLVSGRLCETIDMFLPQAAVAPCGQRTLCEPTS